MVSKFDESQPRDENGRWSDGGGAAVSAHGDDGDSREMFHGTSRKRLASIFEHGLSLSHAGESYSLISKHDRIYMTDSLDDAKAWARDKYDGSSARDAHADDDDPRLVVVDVHIPKDIRLGRDRTPVNDITGDRQGYTHKGDIKPEWVRGAWLGTYQGDEWTYVPRKPKAGDDGEHMLVPAVLVSSRKSQKFDESQPRDERGRWSGGGGSSSTSTAPLQGHSQLPPPDKADVLPGAKVGDVLVIGSTALSKPVADALNFSNTSDVAIPKAVADGFSDAMTDLRQVDPSIADEIATHMSVVAGAHASDGALLITVTGSTGSKHIAVNTNITLPDVHEQDPNVTVTAKLTGKGELSDPEYVRKYYKEAFIHEAGHVLDGRVSGALSDAVYEAVSNTDNFPTQRHALVVLAHEVSKYAAASQSEAAAEMYHMVMRGKSLPPSFEGVEKAIRDAQRAPIPIRQSGKAAAIMVTLRDVAMPTTLAEWRDRPSPDVVVVDEGGDKKAMLKYDEHQPRDEGGRWSDGGGGDALRESGARGDIAEMLSTSSTWQRGGSVAAAEQYVLEHGGDDVEHLVMVDRASGEMMTVTSNDMDSVVVPLDERTNNPKSNIEFVHNHPGGWSLSADDLNVMAARPGVRRIVATDVDGGHFAAERTDKTPEDWTELSRISDLADYGIRDVLENAMHGGSRKMTSDTASHLHQHAMNEAVSRAGYIKYRSRPGKQLAGFLAQHRDDWERAVASGVKSIRTEYKRGTPMLHLRLVEGPNGEHIIDDRPPSYAGRRRKDVKFDENQPRDENGRWADDGGGGSISAATSAQEHASARLRREASDGANALEKHMSTAVANAEYLRERITSWDHLDSQEQWEAQSHFIDDVKERLMNDGSIPDADTAQEWFNDSLTEDIKDAMYEDAASHVVEKLSSDPAFADDSMFGALRVALDKQSILDAVDYDSDPSDLSINAADVRTAVGNPLTEAQQDVVETQWSKSWQQAVDKQRDEFLSSDAYFELSNDVMIAEAKAQWNALDEDEAFAYAEKQGLVPADKQGFVSPDTGMTPGAPAKWAWGPDADKDSENYVRSRAVALELVNERTEELLQARGITDPTIKPPHKIAQATWAGWVDSSHGGSGYALQLATQNELGAVGRMTDAQKATAYKWVKDNIGGAGDGEEGMKALQAHVRAQWETTQYVLQKAGVEEVDTYRAVFLDTKGVKTLDVPATRDDGSKHVYQNLPLLEMKRNGAQSFTTKQSVANNWQGTTGISGLDRVVIRARVPRTSVLSVPVFGKNTVNEQEVVIAGTKEKWVWDAWRNTAPSLQKARYNPSGGKSMKNGRRKLVVDFVQIDDGAHWLSARDAGGKLVAVGPDKAFKYSDEQPRDDNGRWSGGGTSSTPSSDTIGGSSVSSLYERLAKPDSGFTVSPVTGHEPTGPGHYAVSPYLEAGKEFDKGTMTPADIYRFARTNEKLFARPNHYMGGWHDPETGKIYLDVSVVTDDRDKAAALARAHSQLAYFDFGAGASVRLEDRKHGRQASSVVARRHGDALTAAHRGEHAGDVPPSHGSGADRGGATGVALGDRERLTKELSADALVFEDARDFEYARVCRSFYSTDDTYLPDAAKSAGRQEPELARALVQAWRDAQNALALKTLVAALDNNDTDEAVAVVLRSDFNRRMTHALEPRMARAYLRGVHLAARPLAEHGIVVRGPRSVISFDAFNRHAGQWAQRSAAELVATDNETKEVIRLLIEEAVSSGYTPKETAEAIQTVVGLNAQQVRAVNSFRARLEDSNLDTDIVERRVERYAEAQLRQRAMNIARTELMRATNAGQQALWDEAIKDELIDPESMQKVWIVADDERLCDECEALGAQEPVDIDDDFEDGVQHPPLHPNCRCTVGLVKTKA